MTPLLVMFTNMLFLLTLFLWQLSVNSESSFTCNKNKGVCEKPVITALILAREGSKGIKNKNLAILGNDTLLARTIKLARKFGKFDKIWVSTDGQRIADEAHNHRAEVHLRSKQNARDESPSIDAVREFINFHDDFDILCLLQCTSPFTQVKHLEQSLELISKNEDVSCVFSATRQHDLRWKLNSNGFVSPLNFEPANRPRRQDWSGELVENGMIYMAKKPLLEQGLFQNDRCKVVEIPHKWSLDINTEYDLLIANVISKVLEEVHN